MIPSIHPVGWLSGAVEQPDPIPFIRPRVITYTHAFIIYCLKSFLDLSWIILYVDAMTTTTTVEQFYPTIVFMFSIPFLRRLSLAIVKKRPASSRTTTEQKEPRKNTRLAGCLTYNNNSIAKESVIRKPGWCVEEFALHTTIKIQGRWRRLVQFLINKRLRGGTTNITSRRTRVVKIRVGLTNRMAGSSPRNDCSRGILQHYQKCL